MYVDQVGQPLERRTNVRRGGVGITWLATVLQRHHRPAEVGERLSERPGVHPGELRPPETAVDEDDQRAVLLGVPVVDHLVRVVAVPELLVGLAGRAGQNGSVLTHQTSRDSAERSLPTACAAGPRSGSR